MNEDRDKGYRDTGNQLYLAGVARPESAGQVQLVTEVYIEMKVEKVEMRSSDGQMVFLDSET